jgi:hypothetical protein
MASNRTFRCGFSVVSCPPRSTHTSPSASLAIGQALRVLQTAAPVGHWTLTAAPEKALAAAVARQGRVDRGVRHQRRNDGST